MGIYSFSISIDCILIDANNNMIVLLFLIRRIGSWFE